MLCLLLLVATHLGGNRDRNRMVRQDTPCARKEQEDELQQALELQRMQQQLREEQSVLTSLTVGFPKTNLLSL